jgi:hypothetical protein
LPPRQIQLEVTPVDSVSVPLEATQVSAPPTSPSIPPKRPFEVTQADFIQPKVPNATTSQLIVSPQDSLGEMLAKSVSVPSNITPAPALPTHTQEVTQESVPVHKVLSMLAPHPPHSSSPNFALSIVAATVISSAVLNVGKTLRTHSHKHEDFDNTQYIDPLSGNNFTHRL